MNLTMMSFRSGIATSWQGADGRVKCVHRLVLRQDRRSRLVAPERQRGWPNPRPDPYCNSLTFLLTAASSGGGSSE